MICGHGTPNIGHYGHISLNKDFWSLSFFPPVLVEAGGIDSHPSFLMTNMTNIPGHVGTPFARIFWEMDARIYFFERKFPPPRFAGPLQPNNRPTLMGTAALCQRLYATEPLFAGAPPYFTRVAPAASPANSPRNPREPHRPDPRPRRPGRPSGQAWLSGRQTHRSSPPSPLSTIAATVDPSPPITDIASVPDSTNAVLSDITPDIRSQMRATKSGKRHRRSPSTPKQERTP